MDQGAVEKALNDADEISLGDLLKKVKAFNKYLRSQWKVIVGIGLLGCLAGLGYAVIKKPLYTAVSTFVLEEGSKSSGLSQYAGLASLAGIDLNSGGGIFEGDNIIELYKSRLMIEKTLLSEGDFNNTKQLLIDRYIEFNNLRESWEKNDHIVKISFTGDPRHFSRTQDSIITEFVKTFNKKILSVSKPDKKLNIINVQVTTGDELFAKEFTIKLVETVNDFYVETKTGKAAQNVRVLQHQADSVRIVLGKSLNGVASAIDATPNANPSLQILRVPSQRKQVDVLSGNAIYAEIVKNLEVSKMSLRQETPLIQTIDSPVLPLEVSKLSKFKGAVLGFILGIIVGVVFMLIRKISISVA